MVSVYRPGFSLLVREIRPAKVTLFVPLWPAKVSVPAVAGLQIVTFAAWWTLVRQAVSDTVSSSGRRCAEAQAHGCPRLLSENEKVVPVGVALGAADAGKLIALTPSRCGLACVSAPRAVTVLGEGLEAAALCSALEPDLSVSPNTGSGGGGGKRRRCRIGWWSRTATSRQW